MEKTEGYKIERNEVNDDVNANVLHSYEMSFLYILAEHIYTYIYSHRKNASYHQLKRLVGPTTQPSTQFVVRSIE